jgi:nucleoside-diphosphate-sugar epimerase
MTVLVTGASGFVGGAVVRRLVADGCTTWAGVRTPADLPSDVRQILVGSLGPDTDWRPAVVGADAVVHAAARVHVMRETSGDPLAEFRRANVAGTMALARQAAESGVRRFVFISSIKVNGEGTDAGHPYTSDTPPAPVDPYGISKHEAEQQLLALSTETGMAVSIIRPVLVYGPGVKGNFRSLMRAIERGLPLPLGAIDNRRSLVALDNLGSHRALSRASGSGGPHVSRERRSRPVDHAVDSADGHRDGAVGSAGAGATIAHACGRARRRRTCRAPTSVRIAAGRHQRHEASSGLDAAGVG